MCLFNEAAAKRYFKHNFKTLDYNFNINYYNQRIIDNINATTDKDDYLILFGNITDGSLSETNEYLSQLKAAWDVVDLKDQPLFKIEDLWKDMGARKALTLDGFIGGEIANRQTNVIISTNSSNVKFWLGTDHYIAIAESVGVENEILKKNELYCDKVYNVSLAVHNYKPVEVVKIPEEINNCINKI